jgi:hypothetical protein
MGTVDGIEDYHVQDDDCNDNTDVPSSAVIHDQLGIMLDTARVILSNDDAHSSIMYALAVHLCKVNLC